MQDHIKSFLKFDENVVPAELVLHVFFRQNLEVKYLFNGASASSESCLLFSKNFFCFRLQFVKQDLQHDFAGMIY